jgi:hypothetical protein
MKKRKYYRYCAEENVFYYSYKDESFAMTNGWFSRFSDCQHFAIILLNQRIDMAHQNKHLAVNAKAKNAVKL